MGLFAFLAKILFVGHSLVGPHLPGMVEAGLQHMGESAVVQAQIINGSPLIWNWDHSAEAEGVDGRAVLAKGGVTDLVLTEAIALAVHMEWNDSKGLVARWAKAARAKNPKVRVWVYETWHSLNSGTGVAVEHDPGAGVPWRQRLYDDLPLWEEIAGKNARLIPAGQAMGLLADEIKAGRVPGLSSIRQVFVDDIHPNGKGLYFVAMVHVATLTGKSPEGLPAKLTRTWPGRDSVITAAQAKVFQRIAWKAVSAYRAGERIVPTSAPAAEPEDESAPLPNVVPVDWTPPVAPVFDRIANPDLAVGLAGVTDWTVQQPFLDVMKTARPWTGHLGDTWGGMEDADLRAAGALDGDGWPLRLPEGVSGLSTLFLTDLPEDSGGVAGRYVLTYLGKGELRIEGRAAIVSSGPGKVVFDYTPGSGSVLLTITAIDPEDPIRGMVVVRADRAAALAAGEIFNPDWLARIEGVKVLRFMDWMATNDSTLARAEDRPRVADYTWARNGVPAEVMVALANRLRAEPWLTLPHMAGDDLVRTYAGVVRDGLDPGLRVWVEYSNEVWNWQFQQAHWADERARARWGAQDAWLQFYGARAAEVMGLFAEEMGGTGRMVRVMSTQTGWKGLEEQMLTAPLLVAEGLPPPFESFDAYAVTGYFSGGLGAEDKLPAVRGWIAESANAAAEQAKAQGLSGAEAEGYFAAHRYDLALERAVAELRNGASTGVRDDSLEQLLTDTLPYQASVAASHGLKLAMYEGGTHVVGYGPAVDDPELEEFFVALNYSEGMGGLYADLLAGWAKISDQPFNAFVDISQPGKWGSWGALRHLWDDNPRWQALAKGCRC